MNASVKKIISAVSAIIMSMGFLCGCGNSADEKKETVSVALWGNQLLESYAPWLCEQFPQVDFDFYTIKNSTEYYQFKAEHDCLPDIMTVRRFSLRDVESLKDKLLDLSDTKLANSFYQSYLRNYTYADGTVNWLPACAEIDDIIINKTLFDQNNIPIPTDYSSFIYACKEFEKLGITGYVTDMEMDYSCMETLQGLSAELMNSVEGRKWRKEYESGLTDELNETVWLPAFEKLMDFIQNTGMNAQTLTLDSTDIMDAFDRGEVAMFRGTGADLTARGKDFEKMILPHPGDTEAQSWYLTYPAFQVAANGEAANSEERQKLILDIMTAMLGEDGLKHVSEGKNMVAYNKDVNLELMPEFDNVKEYIAGNRIYIRLASSEMFSISKSVVQKMITGEITDARTAYDEFNTQMKNNNNEEKAKVVHIDEGYSHKFNPNGGNEAASAVYNTVREKLNVDCLIGNSAIVSGDILKGDYTEDEISYMINWDWGNLLKMQLTGDKLFSLVEYALNVKGTRDSVANNSVLPALSGFEMTATKDGSDYKLEKLTMDGENIDPQKTYSVVFRVTYAHDIEQMKAAGFTDYEILDTDIKELLKEQLMSGNQLSEPTDYITLK